MSIYTAEECKERVKELDAKIAELEGHPQSQSVGPFSVSNSGKMAELQSERDRWQKRLRKARREASGGSSMQTGSTIS